MKRDSFQAIADPTRRAILELLTQAPMTPNALAEHFATSRQAISKHLQLLKACGVIEPYKTGREMHYQLNAHAMQEIDRWLIPFRKRWATRFHQLDQLLPHINPNPHEK
ncbi:DNA-binding transcriptional regulator, ArsR family [Catalinimonas alkaloidigena]|uniref:DNA-binding transcriptional regulator, ArsR family n=1 Tax=Catalinimonas alkaloidigena TaxID=1075417 RepID=A0A1G9H168_9BACT|nr:metalloregulator ArsR/SmtB family transcription factor [Catalinimonas alkaloidigena]SDL06680.1 DNA-binding transcriptional regulator, ArsR family [Catalinimonas alkaloidigena]